jgi:tRNA(fMet)-specific endonuclease VapC
MIADTTFLVDVLRSVDKKTEKKVNELDHSFSTKFISTITVLELWSGVYQSKNPKKQSDKIKKILESFIILPFKEEDAKIAGKIEAELILNGNNIGITDIMIAASAIKHNQSILTRNVKHFSKVKGIKIETY